MGRRQILSEDEVKQAYTLYQTGVSLDLVGESLYVSGSAVREAFIRRGLTIRPKKGMPKKFKLTPEQVSMAAEMVQNGKTHAQIGETFGISETCVQTSLKRNGYATRRVKK